MKTDKQIHSIFLLNPEWFFELTGLASPGPCQWRSTAIKAIEQTADGVIYPLEATSPLTITEVQAYLDPFIYVRIVIEMAMIQRQEKNRDVQGVVLFLHEELDPKIEPWCQIIHSFYLDQLLQDLAAQDPDHPLVAVFQPVLQADDKELEKQAAVCYNRIESSSLPSPTIKVLLDVFVNWLEQRFKHFGKLEIENMLLGELPDLRDTQSGKDLINIGKVEGKLEGKIEGKIESLLILLNAKFGQLDSELQSRIKSLKSVDIADRALLQIIKIDSIDQFKLL